MIVRFFFAVFISLAFIACQTSPLGRGDNPQTLTSEVMAQLKRNAPSKISPPQIAEETIITRAVFDWLTEKDKRFFPLVAHLKDKRVLIAQSDAEKNIQSEAAKKDNKYRGKLLFYKLALMAYTNPTEANREFAEVEISNEDKPKDFDELKLLLTKRLSDVNNQLTTTQLELLQAEAKRDVPLQIALHRELSNLELSQNNHSKAIFHLRKLIDLTPENDVNKLDYYQKLITAYRANKQEALAKNAAQSAITFAKKIGDESMIRFLSEESGIVINDEKIVEFANSKYQEISQMEKAIIEDPTQYNNARNLIIVANNYKTVGNNQNAVNLAVRALGQARTEKDINAEGLAIMLTADGARINGDLSRAIVNYQLAVELFANRQDSALEELLLALSKLAVTAMYAEDLATAENSLNRTKSILAENLPTTVSLPIWNARYEAQKFMFEALRQQRFDDNSQNWRNALNVLQRSDNNLFLEEVIAETAIVLNMLGQYQNAATFYNLAIDLANNQNRYFEEARYNTNLTFVIDRLGDKRTAKSKLYRAAQIFQSLKSPHIKEVMDLMQKLDNN